MRVYLAADMARAPDVADLARALEAANSTVRIVSRWLDGADDRELSAAGRIGGPPDADAARAAADRNLADIDECDVFVVLSTGEPARGGVHCEAGYACARGKRVIVAGPVEHAFHRLATVETTDAANLASLLRT